MSILSQIGIVVLIGCIIFILIRSNKTLKEASEEGEHFVDEWALRQQKKEERALEKEERRQEKAERLRDKKESKKNKRELLYEEEESWDREDDRDEDADNDQEDGWNSEPEQSAGDRNAGREKIISMDQYRNPGIVLVQLDEAHRPTARVRVTRLPFTIGRSADNMLVLDDLCVARKHCRIVEKNGAFILEDVGTANKLFAGGAVTDHVVLSDQTTFYIGNVEFRVEMGMTRSGSTHLYQGAGERYYE